MTIARSYTVGNRVVFRRDGQTLSGKILAMDPKRSGQRASQRKVTIKTEVPDGHGIIHHGNATVGYDAIVGLAEESKQSEVQP